MPGQRTPLVQAVQLEKRYVDGPAIVHVLAGLDLEVEAGERIAIVGESGVGKSTLLHLLGALDQPTGAGSSSTAWTCSRARRPSWPSSATARSASSSSSTTCSATSPRSRTSCCRA